MDWTIYEWEVGGDADAPARLAERRILLERSLKRAFPMIVDARFTEILRRLDARTEPAG